MGLCVDGAWACASLLVNDVTLVVDSHVHLRALAVALWEWCWRSILEPYPGYPKTFVAVLGHGVILGSHVRRLHAGGVFTSEMSAFRTARRAGYQDVRRLAIDNAAIITIPIDEGIRVLGARLDQTGW